MTEMDTQAVFLGNWTMGKNHRWRQREKRLQFQSIEASIPTEMQLVLAATGTAIDPHHGAKLAGLIQPELDWKLVIAMARHHYLDGMVYEGLTRAPSHRTPPQALAELRELALANARHNLVLCSKLVRLLEVFGHHGIKVLLLKGIALGQMAYANHALRRGEDLDLLVAPAQLVQAVNLLRAKLGFQIKYETIDLAHALRTRTLNEVILTDGDTVIDLHWRCAPFQELFPARTDDLFRTARRVDLAGTQVPIPDPANLIAYLCFHGCKHLWSRFHWLADLAALSHRFPDWDWETIRRRGCELGQERHVALGLLLAGRILDAPIPRAFEAYRKDPSRSLDLARLERLLFQPIHDQADYHLAPSNRQKLVWAMRLRPGLRTKLTIAWRMAVQPSHGDLKAVGLAAPLYPLYALIKPFRLLWKWLKGKG